MEWITLVIGLAVGLALGWAIFRLREGGRTADLRIANAQLEQELHAEREKVQWTEIAEQKLREAFTALASQSLSTNSQQFLTHAQRELKTLVDPLSQKLDTMDQQVRALETKREGRTGSSASSCGRWAKRSPNSSERPSRSNRRSSRRPPAAVGASCSSAAWSS